MPIGGLKEKLLAALRGGIKTVLIPQDNAKDLADIPDNVKDGLEIIPVKHVSEVLERALVRAPESIEWDEEAEEAAALERLCQVVRIRGFRIASMAVETAGEHLNIALTLEGTRPIAMLQSQLEKLHTVAEVALAAGSVARSRSA